MDRFGGDLGRIEVAADANGYLQLWRWAQELGEPAFAVEGTGSYGAGLSRFLVAAACEMYECERPRRRDRRKGKSDLIDATLAGRCLLSGEGLARLRGGGAREDLRLLLLGAARRRAGPQRRLEPAAGRTPPRPLAPPIEASWHGGVEAICPGAAGARGGPGKELRGRSPSPAYALLSRTGDGVWTHRPGARAHLLAV